MVATVSRETGWSFHDVMWIIPASVVMQVYDIILYLNGAELRWRSGGVDIDKILNG